jgi:hypothetical protein
VADDSEEPEDADLADEERLPKRESVAAACKNGRPRRSDPAGLFLLPAERLRLIARRARAR